MNRGELVIGLERLADILYGPGALVPFPTPELYRAMSDYRLEDVDELVHALARAGLLRPSLNATTLHQTTSGKMAREDACMAVLVLGDTYNVELCQHAVVHVIVTGPTGESGASGFFSADFPSHIATANHVVPQAGVLLVEDSAGTVISRGPFNVIRGPDDVDIALIECPAPDATRPIRIEWRPEEIRPLDHVLLMGYPPLPFHHPALFHARAEIHSVANSYTNRSKLIVSSITRPGCSGGPVINARGFVVGIIEQENLATIENQTYSFFSATPGYYFREIAGF